MRLTGNYAFNSKLEHDAACRALCVGDIVAYERWLGSQVEKLRTLGSAQAVLLPFLLGGDPAELARHGITYFPDKRQWWAFPSKPLEGFLHYLPLRWREAHRRFVGGLLDNAVSLPVEQATQLLPDLPSALGD